MRASVIIPAYNAAATLEQCLTACLAQDHDDFEVIVVDDGSTDNTAAIARAMANIRYQHQGNRGPAAARNAGARIATGDVLVYTDADCLPRPDWLSHLLRGFGPGVAAVGGTYALANPDARLARVIQAEIAARHGNFGDHVDFLGSFNVAYSRSAFEAAGGFDESFRAASGEDNDLAYRLQGALRFTPRAVVAHYHPERLWPYLRTQARHGFWRVKLYRKHPRRATGDQYAGWPDLVAPPLGLLLLPIAGVILAGGLFYSQFAAAAIATALLGLLQLGLHAPLARRLSGLSTSDLLYFTLIAGLRDVARGIGLAAGVWTFGWVRERND